MSNLHTKLEQEVNRLKTKLINAENDIKALKNKLDVWRNEANNTIKNVKQDYTSLDGDFIKLTNYIIKLFTPTKLPDDLMKRINNMKSVPVPQFEDLHGNFYDVIIEEGLSKSPCCKETMTPLNSPMDDPDYFHYRCPKCKMDYKKENKAGKKSWLGEYLSRH